MKNQDKYRSVPHGELIIENGSITIPSIFMFSSAIEMQDFVHSCKMLNCTVYFVNERITIIPEDNGNMSARLAGYGAIIAKPEIAREYMTYLFYKDEMSWDDVEKDGVN